MSEIYLAKNLKYLRAKFHYSQEQAAEKLGISRGSYKDYELEAFPKPDVLVKIADLFSQTLDALLRTDIETSDRLRIRNHDESLKILSIVVDASDKEYIQYVPEKARAGYLTGFANPSFVGQLPSFRLPHLPVGSYRAFEITGDSMPPVNHKSVVIGRYVESFSLIKNLYTYVLVTKNDGISYKRIIYKPKEKKIICLSDNPAYEPYTLAATDVLELWSYHCHIDFGGQNTPQRRFYKELLESATDIEDLDKYIHAAVSAS